MRTATVREVQHGLSAVLERVQRGQEITITKYGRIIAKMIPVKMKPKNLEWPDFEARMKRLFPKGPPRGKSVSEIIDELREEQF